MTVKDLIEMLSKLDPEKQIIAQVVDNNGGAWNCWLEVNDIKNSSLVQVAMSHPDLIKLPDIEVIA